MISRLRHLIFDNALLKMTSLIIAILMWYGVAHEPVAEISVRVPIEFSEPPKNLDFASDVAPQAQVWLRGPARLLRDLQAESVHVVIDLRGATTGEHTYDLTAEQVHVPQMSTSCRSLPRGCAWSSIRRRPARSPSSRASSEPCRPDTASN